jgi:DNA modification methylase
MKAVGRTADKQLGHSRRHQGFNERWDAMERAEQLAGGSNLRSVWWLSPAQFSDAHFATMPESLAEICVTGGSPHGGTVLDPFGGAGTTGLVADRLQRDAILIELNPEYAEIARRRISSEAGMFAEVLAA